MNPQHQVFDGTVPAVPTARQLHRLLDNLVEMTGLYPISPVVVSVRNPDWSAYVLIAESHISIHGIDKRVWVDVFSCKPFNLPPPSCMDILAAYLGGTWRTQRIQRMAADVDASDTANHPFAPSATIDAALCGVCGEARNWHPDD